MNVEHTRQALEYLKSLDPEQLKMDDYFTVPDGYDPLSLNEAKNKGWHCGSPACFAGHVQAKFAQTDAEREAEAYEFSGEFLGMNTCQGSLYFGEETVYGIDNGQLEDVTLDDVISVVGHALAGEEWNAGLSQEIIDNYCL